RRPRAAGGQGALPALRGRHDAAGDHRAARAAQPLGRQGVRGGRAAQAGAALRPLAGASGRRVVSESTPIRRELAEWLRDAYADAAPGCPRPEASLADELAALQPDERRRLEAHADACPACNAERELAPDFDPGRAGHARRDVDWV